MAELTVLCPDKIMKIPFEAPAKLQSVLQAAGVLFDRPCGGRGVCGKCRAELSGLVSEPNEAERKVGCRLLCQAELLGDATLSLTGDAQLTQIESTTVRSFAPAHPMPGEYGFAVDIGTTTVVVQLYDLKSGKLLAESSGRNRQIAVAADVMGRIGQALEGKADELRSLISDQIRDLMTQTLKRAGLADKDAPCAVVTGNTTMLYLLTGRNPECLSHAPFVADTLFDTTLPIWGRQVYLPPCFGAFVGADIACAVLFSGLCSQDGTSLLCDIGTNGEMALWHKGTLSVCSTAAGPAFEGAGISCGCPSIPGAIFKVETDGHTLTPYTLGDLPPVGLCGSGLIDTVACLLQCRELDETGYLEDDYPIAKDVHLSPADIRALQLAKAAIAAGMETLLDSTNLSASQLETLYLAGGFGNHLNLTSAARIGLIPEELIPKAKPIGNAALSGAAMLLLNTDLREKVRTWTKNARTVILGGNPKFNQAYVDQMIFPE